MGNFKWGYGGTMGECLYPGPKVGYGTTKYSHWTDLNKLQWSATVVNQYESSDSSDSIQEQTWLKDSTKVFFKQ